MTNYLNANQKRNIKETLRAIAFSSAVPNNIRNKSPEMYEELTRKTSIARDYYNSAIALIERNKNYLVKVY